MVCVYVTRQEKGRTDRSSVVSGAFAVGVAAAESWVVSRRGSDEAESQHIQVNYLHVSLNYIPKLNSSAVYNLQCSLLSATWSCH